MQDQAVTLLASSLEQFMARYGYEKIETPIIQPAELFLSKAGDQIIHRLFTFERLGRQLALRPEFTALAAHAYVTQFPADQQPVIRWQFGGAVFEDASGDSQRFSIGAELIGMSGMAADAEIVALAANGAVERGLSRWNLVIGHVQLMRVLLERFRLDSRTQRFLLHHLPALKQPGKAYVLDQLDKLLLGKNGQDEIDADSGSELSTQQMLDVLLDATQHGVTMGGRSRHDIVRRLLQKRQRATERVQVAAALDFLEAWSAINAAPDEAFDLIGEIIAPDDAEARRILDQWRAMIALLDAYGIPARRIQIQPALARNWDYYTGIVFELWSEGGHHIGGGGRYDELARLIGGQRDIPAVGFAYYVDQLLAALPAIKPAARQIMTLMTSPENAASAIRWAQALRERGLTVALLETGAPTDEAVLVAASDGSLHQGSREYHTLDALLDDLELAR